MISTVESRGQRRLIVEGKLIAPWTAELKLACEEARTDLDGRELVIDLKNLTAISQEGESLLFELMKERVKFRSHDVFTKRVLSELGRRLRRNIEEMKI